MYNINKIRNKILLGDTLEELKKFPPESIDCIVTSPPYWRLRDYRVEGQIGLEATLKEYIEKMLKITAELKRILKKTGVFFLNWGDCYGGNNRRAGLKNSRGCMNKKLIPAKCMTLQNYRIIIRMIDEQQWILRNIVIWYKPNAMPSSVKDRFANKYEPVFMLVKSKKYWFDLGAVRIPHKTTIEEYRKKLPKSENNKTNFEAGAGIIKYSTNSAIKRRFTLGKNPGDVWQIPIQPFPEAHFATFPERLVEPMIKAGCPQWICKKCGKARERITRTKYEVKSNSISRSIKEGKEKEVGLVARNFTGNALHYTIGWTDCGCNAGWEQGIVLDPFMGAGTTALVATKLNRDWIGIELNPEYIEIAYRRLNRER